MKISQRENNSYTSLMKKYFSVIFIALLVTSCQYLQPSEEDIANANYLAEKSIITQQEHLENYQFNTNTLRIEVVEMTLKMMGKDLNPECRGDFSDVSWNAKSLRSNALDVDITLTCRIMETAKDAGIISTENSIARAHEIITRAEALAILMKAFSDEWAWAGYSYYWDANFPLDGDDVGYKDAYLFREEWQAQVFYDYIRKVLQSTDALRINPFPDAYAPHRDVYGFARNILSRKIALETPIAE